MAALILSRICAWRSVRLSSSGIAVSARYATVLRFASIRTNSTTWSSATLARIDWREPAKAGATASLVAGANARTTSPENLSDTPTAANCPNEAATLLAVATAWPISAQRPPPSTAFHSRPPPAASTALLPFISTASLVAGANARTTSPENLPDTPTAANCPNEAATLLAVATAWPISAQRPPPSTAFHSRPTPAASTALLPFISTASLVAGANARTTSAG